MPSIKLHPGDNRESLRRLIDQGIRVHSVVTDPPYGLVSIQKRFGKTTAKAARTDKNDGSFNRLSGGFMGKTWDATGIERDPEFWRLIYDILLPGGYVFAFSGSRTGHWQACAMETAGFIMHPMHGWVFGSGFPKAHNAAMAIDKSMGAAHRAKSFNMKGKEGNARAEEFAENGREILPPWTPLTAEAAQWEGWAYGTQTQKPALEPIYLGQKPFGEKTGAANLLKYGVGAVNIDGCRVGYINAEDQDSAKPQGKATAKVGALAGKTQNDGERSEFVPDNTKGRHPANLILDGSPEVVAMFPNSNGSGPARQLNRSVKSGDSGWGMNTTGENQAELRDAGTGSAARFFHHFPPDTDPLFYHPKASKVDRAGSKHPTVKPIALMQYLIRHITPPGGVVLDPFAGSGTTAEAALREGFDCILMEAEPEYLDFLDRRFDLGLSKQTASDPLDDLFDDLLGDSAPENTPSYSTNYGFEDILG